MPETKPIRLNRFLASCGLGSRRRCEALITDRRVTVNGNLGSLGTRVSDSDAVKLDGKRLAPQRESTLLIYKPTGVLTTRADPGGRQTVYDLLPPKLLGLNLHHAGRLDMDSEGLLILTNSGDLSQRLTRPSGKIEKEYHVTLGKALGNPALLEKLVGGVATPEGVARAVSAELLSRRRVCLVLCQGLKRQIRHMMAAIGHRVDRLERVRIGCLTAPNLKPGNYLMLTDEDIAQLLRTPPKSRRPDSAVVARPDSD